MIDNLAKAVNRPHIHRRNLDQSSSHRGTTSGGSSAIAVYMTANKLFEKHAARLGLSVKPKYITFQTGPAMNEAFAAGQTDIDIHFSGLVNARRIGAGLPSVPIAIVGSHISNALLVRPGSKIKSVEDLPGKTVGLPLGSSAHYLLNSILYYHLGDTARALLPWPVGSAVR